MAKNKDAAVTRGVLVEVLTSALKEQDHRFDQKLHDLRQDVRDEIHSSILASEKRMMKYIDAVKIEIIDDFTDVLDEFVFPPIAELQADMARVKDHLQMA